MKTILLIATLLVITVCACQKAIPDTDANLRALVGAPGRPPARHDSTTAKHDSIASKPADTAKVDTTTVPTPPFPQHTVDSLNNNDPGGSGGSSGGSGSGGSSTPGVPATPAPSCPVLPIYGD